VIDPHAFLDALAPSTLKLGLARMRAADAALGHPWRAYRALHVAGTNGKGSTCAFAEAMLRAGGHRVGLYTSPHLERVNERIQLDGRPITDLELARGIDAVCAAYPPAADPAHPDALTYFEFLTALALWTFRAHGVALAVVEVGLGGRLDATNVITPAACAIATIGLDHTEYLGDTLGEIAAEKAGILEPGVPAAVLTQNPEALGAIEQVAREVGAPLSRMGVDFAVEGHDLRVGDARFGPVSLALAGDHQKDNAALAVQAALLLDPQLDRGAIVAGLARARWPGRLERLGDVLLDGAHNPEGARALARYLKSLHRPIHLVFGALADKDVPAMLDALLPGVATAHLVAPPNPRARDPHAHLAQAQALTRAQVEPSLEQALARARQAARADGGQAVVAGSLFLVGAARRHLNARG